MNTGSNAILRPDLPVTIALRVKLDSITAQGFFHNNFYENYYSGVWLYTAFEGKLAASFGDGSPVGAENRRTKAGTTVLQHGVWYHVAVVIRGALDMDLYVNGIDDEGTYTGVGGTLTY
ncbi:MAG: hypothetical protein JSV33_03655 [bacterium]|nr:MAG: hypothetical protein JSV33_03655 [bacterium]